MVRSNFAILATSLALFPVSGFGGCAEPEPPAVDYFWDNPGSMVVGDSSTLKWRASDASTVTIAQDVGSVAAVGTTTIVSLTGTTSYTLTAATSAEIIASSAVVTVSAPPPPTPTDGDVVEDTGGSTQGTGREITFEDTPQVLDMSADLPARFQRQDAASAGLTIPDLGLSLNSSGVAAFSSAEPMQAVAAVMTIVSGTLIQIGVDVLLQNEEMFVSMVRAEIEKRLAEQGLDNSKYEVNLDFSHPAISEAAVLGRGVADADLVVMSYEAVAFRDGEVLVFCASAYRDDGVTVASLTAAISARIE